MDLLLLALACWAAFGLWGYKIGTAKGYTGVESFLIGAFLGILAPLMYFASSKGKKCPHCGEVVRKEADVCRFCHSPLTTEQEKAA